MTFPKLVPLDKIKDMRKAEEERIKRWEEVNYDPATHVADSVLKRHKQERWLELFGKCLSPGLACKQSGVPMSAYRKWRAEDLWFAEQLNTTMEDWREELLSSAVTRAIGYTRVDENGELVRDASGKVVYTDGSDSLARQLLQMDQGEKGAASLNVTVNIDLRAAGYVVEVSDSASALEGEFTEVGADDRIPTYDESKIR